MSEEIRINPITDALRERPEPPLPYLARKESRPMPGSTQRSERPVVSERAMHQAVDKLNEAMIGANTSLRFRVDAQAELLVVSIVDDETGDVVQQMPAEDVVEAARRLHGGAPHTLEISA